MSFWNSNNYTHRSKQDDMIRYLRTTGRLDVDTTPDAMDSSREADILQKNSRIFLKNVFEAMTLQEDLYPDFY